MIEFKTLYNDLFNKKPARSFDQLIDLIDDLDETSIEVFYALILEYYIRNEKKKKVDPKDFILKSIPYNGKKASQNGGVVMRVEKLPLPLRNILANFLDR